MSVARDESQILMKIIMPERFPSFVVQRETNLLRDPPTDKAYLGDTSGVSGYVGFIM